jgi:hypothetical protein
MLGADQHVALFDGELFYLCHFWCVLLEGGETCVLASKICGFDRKHLMNPRGMADSRLRIPRTFPGGIYRNLLPFDGSLLEGKTHWEGKPGPLVRVSLDS